MTRKPLQIFEANAVQKGIRSVALKTARSLSRKKALHPRERDLLYTTSGLQLVFRTIINDGVVRDHVDAIFIEFSTLISTLEETPIAETVLDAFTLVWHNRRYQEWLKSKKEQGNPQPSVAECVQKHFQGLVDELREQHTAVFNHPEFFIQPTKLRNLMSIIHGEDLAKHKFDERQKELRKSLSDPDRDRADDLTDPNRIGLRTALRLLDEHDYRGRIRGKLGPESVVSLFEHKDHLKNQDVYFTSSALMGAGLDQIKNPELLKKYARNDVYGLHFLSHLLYDDLFVHKDDEANDDQTSIFLSIPLVGSKSRLDEAELNEYKAGDLLEFDGGTYEGMGAILIYLLMRPPSSIPCPESSPERQRELQHRLFDSALEVLIERLGDLSYELPTIVKDFIHGYAVDISLSGKDQIKQHAARALMSQVMARNMSHNIGSHVAYKATNRAIKQRILELYDEQFKNGGVRPSDRLRELNADQVVTEWIDFMAEKLDKYQTSRHEYVTNPGLSPQNIFFYKDLILPFVENTLILDNIASAEGLRYAPKAQNRLKIRVFVKPYRGATFSELCSEYPILTSVFSSDDDSSSTVISYPHNFPYLLKAKPDAKGNEQALDAGFNVKVIIGERPDVEVTIHSPHGFYSILENFIRNSAKHNRGKIGDRSVVVRLYLEEQEDRFIVVLCDDISLLGSEELFNQDPDAKQGLYQRIKQNLFSGESTARNNLGFADMNINSFLFRKPASLLKSENYHENFDLVTTNGECAVVQEQLPTGEYSFGYRMEMLKPKKVLWIGKDTSVCNGDRTLSSWKANGIITSENLDSYTSASPKDEISAFEFVVFGDSFDFDEYVRRQELLPPRVLVLPDFDTSKITKPNIRSLIRGPQTCANANELLELCWESWLHPLGTVKTYVHYEDNASACSEIDSIELGALQEIKCTEDLDELPIAEGETVIVYDHHGGVSRHGKLAISSEKDNFYTHHTRILFDKGSEDFARLNYLSHDLVANKFLAYRLIDAATTNVFILDERIAAASSQRPSDSEEGFGVGRKYARLNFSRYCFAKVFVISSVKSCGSTKGTPILAGGNPDQLCLAVLKGGVRFESEDLEALGAVDLVRKDVLVIHRTYLKEKVLGVSVPTFLELCSQQFGSVVVTSGAGPATDLQPNLRFIPFSCLDDCVNSRVSKLRLVSQLQTLVSVA